MDFEGNIENGYVMSRGVNFGNAGRHPIIGFRWQRYADGKPSELCVVFRVKGGSSWASRGESAYFPTTDYVCIVTKADPKRPVNLGGSLWFREVISYNTSGRSSPQVGGGFEPERVDEQVRVLLKGGK